MGLLLWPSKVVNHGCQLSRSQLGNALVNPACSGPLQLSSPLQPPSMPARAWKDLPHNSYQPFLSSPSVRVDTARLPASLPPPQRLLAPRPVSDERRCRRPSAPINFPSPTTPFQDLCPPIIFSTFWVHWTPSLLPPIGSSMSVPQPFRGIRSQLEPTIAHQHQAGFILHAGK